MSKSRDDLDNYPLFYEAIGSQTTDQNKSAAASQDSRIGLSKEQLSRLSDDLRSPVKNRSNDSNPLQ